MEVRLTRHEDIKDVVRIIDQAKAYFKRSGIDQWQDGYPNQETIESDISVSKSFVLIDHNQVVGSMYFAIEDDPTYFHIEEGQWLTSNQPYAVIHRIVVDEEHKGKSLAKELVDFAIQTCHEKDINSIRIDTHFDNLSMQRFLTKNEFQKCGTIYLESLAKRMSFERVLNK